MLPAVGSARAGEVGNKLDLNVDMKLRILLLAVLGWISY
jgi:hypothetical protein